MAVADIRPARGEEHPADLLDRAAGLDREADQLREQAEQLKVRAKDREAQAAALRHKAQRLRDPSLGVTVKRARPKALDPLMGAAALAVEDMEGVILATTLAEALNIGSKRAAELLEGLVESEKVERNNHGGYRAIDPEIGRIRDLVVEIGAGTNDELAERAGMRVESLRWYIAHLRQRGVVDVPAEGRWEYVQPGAERVITRRRRAPTPEEEIRRREGIRVERGETVPFTGKPQVETGGTQRSAAERRKRGGRTKKRKAS